MTIQDSAVAGAHVTTLQRRTAKAYPVPVGDEASRPFNPKEGREAAFSGVYVGPWGATQFEHAEARLTTVLKRIDAIALGLVYAAVLGLPLFAICFMIGAV
ncbi:MAG TPA: hypothetical protein VGF71_07340 [Caulobacteraceae bacterium]|jgi:hypothetical protein